MRDGKSRRASKVCAFNVRPESKMVTEIWTGISASDFLEGLFDGKERGLGVEGVEDGLDEERVAAAFHEAERLLLVGRDELDVGDAARARIVGVAGNGERSG